MATLDFLVVKADGRLNPGGDENMRHLAGEVIQYGPVGSVGGRLADPSRNPGSKFYILTVSNIDRDSVLLRPLISPAYDDVVQPERVTRRTQELLDLSILPGRKQDDLATTGRTACTEAELLGTIVTRPTR